MESTGVGFEVCLDPPSTDSIQQMFRHTAGQSQLVVTTTNKMIKEHLVYCVTKRQIFAAVVKSLTNSTFEYRFETLCVQQRLMVEACGNPLLASQYQHETCQGFFEHQMQIIW